MLICTRDFLIKDLFDKVELTVRAFNVCETLSLKTVRDLHEHIQKNGNFLSTRNCGYRTNIELLEFHKLFYLDSIEDRIEEIDINDHEGNKVRTQLINDAKNNSLLITEFDKLSMRARNVFFEIFGQKNPNLDLVKEFIFNADFNPKKLKNVGVKTFSEINKFIEQASALIEEHIKLTSTPNELAKIKLQEITGLNVCDEYYVDKFISKEFPIIKFTLARLPELLNFNKTETCIFNNHFGLLDKRLTLEDIGKKYKLTRERIRQKKNIVINKAESQLEKLSLLIDYSQYKDAINFKNILSLPSDINDENIRKEIEEAGLLFSTFVLGNLFNSEIYSLTSLDKIERPKKISLYQNYSIFKNIRGYYLINNIISKKEMLFFFKSNLQELCSIQKKEKRLPLSVSIGSDLTLEKELILSSIVEREYELPMLNSSICFPKTSNKKVFEFAREALLNIGKPAHLSEIISEIRKFNPEFNSQESSLRSALGKERDVFIYFGRSSTFGLKVWENKHQNIKGGTIRDIVEEFLMKYDIPCNFSSITEYVNKYRKTDGHSIMNNIKMCEESRFVFYKGGYVGLVTKKYNVAHPKSKKYKLEKISLDELMTSIFLK